MRKMSEADRIKNQERSGLRLGVYGSRISKDKALCREKKKEKKKEKEKEKEKEEFCPNGQQD